MPLEGCTHPPPGLANAKPCNLYPEATSARVSEENGQSSEGLELEGRLVCYISSACSRVCALAAFVAGQRKRAPKPSSPLTLGSKGWRVFRSSHVFAAVCNGRAIALRTPRSSTIFRTEAMESRCLVQKSGGWPGGRESFFHSLRFDSRESHARMGL